MNVDFTNKRNSFLLLFLPVSFLVLFLILPVLYTFYLSLFDNTTGFFTFENYLAVFSNSLDIYFFYWTIQQALVTTILCIVIGLGGSYILANFHIPFKSLIRNILTVPFLIPSIAVLIGFLAIYPLKLIFSYQGIILANLFYNLPLMIRLTEIGWTSIDPEYELVAKSLGMSRIQYFLHVQLPHLLPMLLTASLLTFVYCFNSFAIVLVLGGIQYQTIEVRIYSLVKLTFDYNHASALAIIQLGFNIIIIIAYVYFSSKYEANLSSFKQDTKLKQSATSQSKLKKLGSRIVVAIYSVIILVVCILPLAGVFYRSLISNLGVFTLDNYEKLFDNRIKDFIGLTSQNMILNSVIYAICVFCISILFSLLLNFGLKYKTTKTGNPIVGLNYLTNIIVILPLMVSAITMIYSIFSLYANTVIFSQVSILIIIAQVLLAFPFANRIIATARANINEDMLHVGRSVGMNRLQVFIKIELPILIPNILIAGLFSFAISLGEFASTNFVSRGTTATIPIGIYRLVTTRHLVEASAFSSILIFVTLVMFLLIEKIGKGTVDYKI